jgi:hypothetical protein
MARILLLSANQSIQTAVYDSKLPLSKVRTGLMWSLQTTGDRVVPAQQRQPNSVSKGRA